MLISLVLCAILKLEIRAYCLPVEHVNFPGSAGLLFFFFLPFMSVGILDDVWLVLCFTKCVMECHLLLGI